MSRSPGDGRDGPVPVLRFVKLLVIPFNVQFAPPYFHTENHRHRRPLVTARLAQRCRGDALPEISGSFYFIGTSFQQATNGALTI